MTDTFDDCLRRARTLLSTHEGSQDLWDANTALNTALDIEGTSAEAWVLKSQTLSALDDLHAAFACAELAVRFAPQDPAAHYARATTLSDLDRLEDALLAIEETFQLVGDGDTDLLEDLYYERATLLDTLGRPREALQVFEQGLARFPRSSLLKGALEPFRREQLRDRFTVIEGGSGD